MSQISTTIPGDCRDAVAWAAAWPAAFAVHSCRRACLDEALAVEAEEQGLPAGLLAARPHLFSAAAVVLDARTHRAVADLARALHEVWSSPGWRLAALADAPPAARIDNGALGLFSSIDLHLTAEGPRLIEINTNAGGALLVRLLAAAQARARAAAGVPPLPGDEAHAALGPTVVATLRAEWHRQGRDRPLRAVAVVDDAPETQYLYPEFLLVRRLLEEAGLSCVIADPASLHRGDGLLLADGRPVDLVYNRLCDFDLSQPAHAVLRAAHEAGEAVVTPHPLAHALLADKRRLRLLGDQARLVALGVPPEAAAVVAAAVPVTREIEPVNADSLWRMRQRLFFKPVAGYGAKAVYRGDKLTRRVWEAIAGGGYVAQDLVPAPTVMLTGEAGAMKLDLRAFVYEGRVQYYLARLYRGQATNFRTPGGGFAPVTVG